MTMINRINAVLGKVGLKKAQKPQPAELDEVGKALLGKDLFNTKPQEAVRDAKKSAAFFNAQGMMTRGTEDQTVKNSGKFKSIFDSVKSKTSNACKSTVDSSKKAYSYTADKSKKLFSTIKDTKIGEKTSKIYNSAAEGTKSILSKPVVKKSLKFLGAAAIVLGALYLGKKAYDYYQSHKSAGSVDVKEGDNVWNIAKKDLGSKATNAEIAKRTEELMKLNNLKYANDNGLVIIKPGEKIKLA